MADIKSEYKKEIKNITKQIIEKYHPEKIILFGSAASGNITKDSDIDFLIVKKDAPYLGRDRSRQLRRLINKSVPVDFLIYKPEELIERTKLGDPFITAILSRGKILYGS